MSRTYRFEGGKEGRGGEREKKERKREREREKEREKERKKERRREGEKERKRKFQSTVVLSLGSKIKSSDFCF